MLKLVDPVSEDRRRKSAAELRAFADQVENGEITDWITVGNHRNDQTYLYYSDFDDRWRLMGAIECAKYKLGED